MTVDPEQDTTLKVQVRESQPAEVLSPDFVADSQARTREILDFLHALVLGRLWAWFWGGLLAVALLVMGVLAVTRARAPVASVTGPAMHCLYGQVRITSGPQAEWRRTRRIPPGVRASTLGPRTRRVELSLAHDSTIRLQGASLFSWESDQEGKPSVTFERGRAWIAVAPLDTMHLDFPGGRADVDGDTVAELNLRPRPPARLGVRCRHGRVRVRLPQSKAGREQQFTLAEGQGLQVGNDGVVRTFSQFNADDGWQRWNLALPAPTTR